MSIQLQKFETCPACGSSTDRNPELFAVPLFGTLCPVRRCGTCSLVYKERHPSEAQLAEMYSEEYSHFQDAQDPGAADINSAKQKFRQCHRLLPPRHPETDFRVLDVGCGSGSFVRIARHLGYQAEGVDPYLPRHCEEGFLKRARLQDLPESHYDILFLLNVAEHVVAPRDLFAAALRRLRPGGVMLVTCPYGNSVALKAYRERWVHLALDEHLLFWTPRSLRRVLSELGFGDRERVRIAGSPFPFGRTHPRVQAQETSPASAGIPSAPSSDVSFQRRLWQIARFVQSLDGTARAVRAVVHGLRLGDYLEYAVSVKDR